MSIGRARIGINTHLPQEPALRLAHSLEVGSIRCDFNWPMIQPERHRWDWALTDEVVSVARQLDLEILACLSYVPGWANGGHSRNVPPHEVSDWENFVRTVGQRYRHNIWHWGIFNEPNQPGAYGGSVEQYVEQVLWPAAVILHEIGPENRVIGPDLSTEQNWPQWLTTCLSRAKDAIDIISVHSYQANGREVWRALGQERRWWELWKPPAIRRVIQDAGCGNKPVWLTETGWPSDGATSEAHQAESVDQLLEGLAGNPWVEKVFYYQLLDEPQEQRGLYRQDQSAKPGVEVMQRYARS